MGMILFGALLIYGGWTNRSIWSLARGDNTQPKTPIQPGQSGIRYSSGSAPAGGSATSPASGAAAAHGAGGSAQPTGPTSPGAR